MRCEESDESIVVLKSRPVKAGNSLEDKTGMTGGLFAGACKSQKPCELRREEVYSNVLGNFDDGHTEHKPPDEAGHFTGGSL